MTDRLGTVTGMVVIDGCVYFHWPGHPLAEQASSYVAEHRHMIWQYSGYDENVLEQIRAGTVHHVNGVKDDNRPVNLELWTGARNQPPGVRMADALRALGWIVIPPENMEDDDG